MFIKQKFFQLMIVVALCVLGVVGCAQSTPTSGSAITSQVETKANQTSTYQDITPDVAKQRLETEKGIILLDVRTVEEYTAKHIPGSVLIPVEVIEKEATQKLKDKEAVIFIYCRSGSRSVTAARALVKMGYSKVYNLGGLNDWPYATEAGIPK